MTVREQLLVILMEECSELQKEAAKALRFGLGDVCYKLNTSNAENIVGEFAHVCAMVEMLGDDLPELDIGKIVADKKAKVMKWMQYSAEVGTLDESK